MGSTCPTCKVCHSRWVVVVVEAEVATGTWDRVVAAAVTMVAEATEEGSQEEEEEEGEAGTTEVIREGKDVATVEVAEAGAMVPSPTRVRAPLNRERAIGAKLCDGDGCGCAVVDRWIDGWKDGRTDVFMSRIRIVNIDLSPLTFLCHLIILQL
jgi:hypothetical protein